MSKQVDEYTEYIVTDVLGHIRSITTRKMFGGCSLYLDGTIFGLITSDAELYFKANDSNKSLYESLDSHQFIYNGWKDTKRKAVTMPYWSVPEEIMENKEYIEELVNQSVAISRKT